MVVDWTELVLPALLATGAPCGAPAQPTIEMQPDKRHKKDAGRVICRQQNIIQETNPDT